MAKKGTAALAEASNRLEILEIVNVPIESVVPNSYNPNRVGPKEFELLLRSMREDGFTQAIIVQRATNEIVDGEHRWRAARELKMTEIPVVFVDMSAEQMRFATLRHNRARGSEDFELAAAVLRDLRELGALDKAAESLMLDDKELSRMLDDTPVAEQLAHAEFSQAWEPAVEPLGRQVEVEGEYITHNPDGNEIHRPVFQGATPDAVARFNASVAELEAAPNAMERQRIIRERQVYRLKLTFAGAEAVVVRDGLGNEPAVRLLELCTAELDRLERNGSAPPTPTEVPADV